MKKIKKTKIAIVFAAIFLLLNLSYIAQFLKINSLDNNLISPSQSSPTDNNWYLTWGGGDLEYGTDVLIDNANNIYFAGTTYSFSDESDICIVKYDPFGKQIWNLTCGGIKDDYGANLAFDSLGNVFLACTTEIYKFGVGLSNYICLTKFNSSGQKEWETIWGGDANNEYCRDIVIDSSDNIYVSGDTASFGAGSFDTFLIKFDTDGTEQWFQTWGGLEGDFCGSMDLDSFDNIYLTGDTDSYGTGSNDLFLVKYDGSGNFLWESLWGTSAYDAGEAIVIDPSDNIFIGGSTTSYGSGDWDFCLLKYDINGNFKWYQTRGGIDSDYCYAIALDSYNNIYLAGKTESFTALGKDYYLVQFSTAGIFQWEYIWGGLNSEECYSLKIDKFNSIFMGGYTDTYGLGSRDMCLVKFYEDPHIIIFDPTSMNNDFGIDSPNFIITINNAEFLNDTYYTLNNSQNYYFSGLTGKINQTAWNLLDDGKINLKFFASNLNNTIISDEILIYKDSEVPLTERRAYA
ncbi:MAG: SBBP repeat-containing protein, partial [Promethearchaeota archaeon]